MDSAIKEFFLSFAMSAGGKLVLALLLLLVGIKLIHWFTSRVLHGKLTEKLDAALVSFITSFCSILLYAVLIVTVAALVGVPMASMIAVLGSAGVAIGLALQGGLSNLAGGIMILIFKPFHIGDCIETGSYLGTVTDIGIFYTSITTFDNKVVTIPNGTLSNSSVVDYSTNTLRRVDLKIRIALDSDIEYAKETLHDLASLHELVVHEDPEHPVFVRIGEQTEDALVIYFRVWAKRRSR